MHQPANTPRPSIYYDYTVHQPWLPSEHPAQAVQRVVIAGGGPVGLTAALELARYGVPCVLLESEQQVCEGSRAIVFTRRSMEILQQVGVADRVTQNGLPWRFGNSFYRGERVFRMEAPHDDNDRFGPMINLQQQFLEQYLVEACEANPLIELRWGNRVTAVAQHAGHVQLQVDTPEGPYTLNTEWLVASDGARSGIRSMLDLKLEGASYEGRFVIADIRIDLPLPTERLAFFDPEWNRGNTVLLHREPLGIWRVDYQLPEGETPEQALSPESLKTRINAQLAMIGHADKPWEMDWCSVYSARTLTLPDYRVGRTLFMGDAAHLLPIFGVRGANTGFQDAQALAWRLGLVCRGQASSALLANYSAERVGAAREIIEEAGKSTRFMTPPTRGFRLLRDAVLSLSLTEAFVRPLYHWRTSRPHEYSHSLLNCRADDNAQYESGPTHGAPPLNVRLTDTQFLLDYLGGGFDLLWFGAADALPADVQASVAQWRAKGLPIKVTCITQGAVHAGQQHSPADAPWLQVLSDLQGRAYSRYGVTTLGAAYLLRPDQHICARWLRLDAQRLDAALLQATSGEAP